MSDKPLFTIGGSVSGVTLICIFAVTMLAAWMFPKAFLFVLLVLALIACIAALFGWWAKIEARPDEDDFP